MGVSAVTLNGDTLMSVTDKTVDTDNLLYGATALRNDGEGVTGTVATASPSDTSPAMDGTADAGESTEYSRGDHVHPTDTSRAPVASPTFTGVPAAPTAAAGTNTTQIATTAFVQSALGASVPSPSDTNPVINGTASPGSATTWSRGDHVHPTDTSRQATITASGILKGNGSGGVTSATAGTDYQMPIKVVTNPTLTPTDGVFTWSIAAASAFNSGSILICIYDTSTGELVYPGVVVNQSTGAVTITINNTNGAVSLEAGAYKAVMLGQEGNMAQFVTLDGKLLTSNGNAITIPENNWMGNNVEFMNKIYDHQTTLNETTTFDSWTASTTAKTCIAAKSLSTFSANMLDYEYMIEWIWEIGVGFNEGATMNTIPTRQYGTLYQTIHRRAYGLTNFESQNQAYNYCTSLFTTSSYAIYYNTSGTLTWTSGITYGLYCVITAAGLSSTSANTITVTPKTPAITARSSTTYFATARKADVDSSKTKIRIIGNLYRVDAGSCALKIMYEKAMFLYKDSMLTQKGG